MKLSTTRFGEIEVPEERLYSFPEGLVGFADVREYAVLDHIHQGPFQWLQAVPVPALAFVICDPRLFFSGYTISVKKEDLQSIKLDDVSKGIVMVILTVPADPRQITANLMGPLVLNRAGRLAKQLILSDSNYSTKYPCFVPQG